MKTPKIPKTVYIASNNPSQCVALLKEHQLIVDAEDAQSIAQGLTYLIKNGKENDLSKIISLHPDREMILADAIKFGGYNNTTTSSVNDDEKSKAEAKANNTNAANETKSETKSETKASIINPNTAHVLLGITITLFAIATISFLVKK